MKIIQINAPIKSVMSNLQGQTEIAIITLALEYDKEGGILIKDVVNILGLGSTFVSRKINEIIPYFIVESVTSNQRDLPGAGATPKVIRIVKNPDGSYLNDHIIQEYFVKYIEANYNCQDLIDRARKYFEKNKAV